MRSIMVLLVFGAAVLSVPAADSSRVKLAELGKALDARLMTWEQFGIQ